MRYEHCKICGKMTINKLENNNFKDCDYFYKCETCETRYDYNGIIIKNYEKRNEKLYL